MPFSVAEFAGSAKANQARGKMNKFRRAVASRLAGLQNINSKENNAQIRSVTARLEEILGPSMSDTSQLSRPGRKWAWQKSEFENLCDEVDKLPNETPFISVKNNVKEMKTEVIQANTQEKLWMLELAEPEIRRTHWLPNTAMKRHRARILADEENAKEHGGRIIDSMSWLDGAFDVTSKMRGAILDSQSNMFHAEHISLCPPQIVSATHGYSRFIQQGELEAISYLQNVGFHAEMRAAHVIGGERKSMPARSKGPQTMGQVPDAKERQERLYGGLNCRLPGGQVLRAAGNASNDYYTGTSMCKGSVTDGMNETLSFRSKKDRRAYEMVDDWMNQRCGPGHIGARMTMPMKRTYLDDPPQKNRFVIEPAVDINFANPGIPAFGKPRGNRPGGFGPAGGNGGSTWPENTPWLGSTDIDLYTGKMTPGMLYMEAGDQLNYRMRTKYDKQIQQRAYKREEEGGAGPHNMANEARSAAVNALGSGRESANPQRSWFRREYAPIVGNVIKWGGTGFLFFEVFNQMGHKKAGCYVKALREDSSEKASAKLCHDATWPSALWIRPNMQIKNNCSCEPVYNDKMGPADPVKNMFDAGCVEANWESKPCRKEKSGPGWDYMFETCNALEAFGETTASLTESAASCVVCATQLAATALSGGITGIAAIIAILIICYVFRYIYKNFLAGGGGSYSEEGGHYIEVG